MATCGSSVSTQSTPGPMYRQDSLEWSPVLKEVHPAIVTFLCQDKQQSRFLPDAADFVSSVGSNGALSTTSHSSTIIIYYPSLKYSLMDC
jgi:hypothetical protein